MGSAAAEVAMDPAESFEEMSKQAALMTSCTRLWKELSDHFSTLERNLLSKSLLLEDKLRALDRDTERSMDLLRTRETTIDGSVDAAVARVAQLQAAAAEAVAAAAATAEKGSEGAMLRAFCLKMDSEGFWSFVVGKRKEMDSIRGRIPDALGRCVDPAGFVLEAMAGVFPVDKRESAAAKGGDLGWACVLILEGLVPVLADPVLGESRPLVTQVLKERAREIVKAWKVVAEEKGGLESVKTLDGHVFLQHVVTFGIVDKADAEIYRKLVVGFAWRK